MKSKRVIHEVEQFDIFVEDETNIQQRVAISSIVLLEPPVRPEGTFFAVHVFPRDLPDGSRAFMAVFVAGVPAGEVDQDIRRGDQ